MFKRYTSWVRRHPLALALGLSFAAPSAFADTSAQVSTAPFDTAVSQFTADLTALVGVMAPAIVTIAGVTLIIVAINWLVRKVRGAIGRG